MPGCLNCKHNQSRIIENSSDNTNPKTTLKFSCELGFDKKNNKWWEQNGKKTTSEDMDDMECYEDSDISKALSKMNELVDKMHKIVDDINKNL